MRVLTRRAEESMFESNQALVMRYYREVIHQHQFAVLESLLGASSEFRQETREICAAYAAAFPDLEISVTEWIVTPERVVTRWKASGTHLGDFLGHAATHRRFFTSGIDIFSIAGGKIVDIWQEMNTLILLQQLGILPWLEQPGAAAQGQTA